MADTAPAPEPKNYFLEKYGEPQDESTPEGKANADAIATSDKSQNNYFIQKYGDPDAPDFKPVSIDNTPTVGQRVGGLALEAAKGAAGATQATAGAIDTVAGAVPVLYDKLKSALTGVQDTSAQDWWFKTFVDPAAAAAHKELTADPTTGFAGKAANTAGSTLENIAQMVISGGEAAPEITAGQVAEQGVTKTVADQTIHGVTSATVPAVSAAVNKGREVYQQTGDAKQAIEAAQADYLTNAIGAVMPLSKAGGVPVRAATGAVSGAVTGEMGRELQNAVVSDPLQQPFSMEDTALNTLSGSVLGTVMGPRAETPLTQPRPPSAVDAVKAQVQDNDVLPSIQAKARADAAARGGDAMDQEVAAALATLHHTELARHLSLKDSQDKAFSDAEQQDQIQRDQAQQAAAERYAAYQAEEQQRHADTAQKADAFVKAQNDQAAQRQKTEQEAYAQREEQKGAEIEQQAPYVPEPATTKLGDVAPPEVIKLAEPAAKPPDEPAAPTEPAPEATPVGPLDIKLQKPVEDGEPWGITVHDKLLTSYSDEATARKQLRTMRNAIREHAAIRDAEKPDVAPLKAEPLTPEEGPALSDKPDIEPVTGEIARETIDTAAKDSAFHPDNGLPEPTPAQYKAQNYQMGHTEVAGLPVTIEHPAGSERPLGDSGQTRTMPAHYGYFKGTVDAGGQHTDVVIGKQPDAPSAFVIDHLTADGQYEQHKVMVGYPNELAAKRDYRKIYPDRPVGPVTEMPIPKLKEWLGKKDTSAPLQPDKIKPVRVERSDKEASRGLRFAGAENNASGESAASFEAVSRVEDEKAKGQSRFRIDPNGDITPLHGVDAVDARAPMGHIVVQKGIGDEPYTILDRGSLPHLHARGLLNRARAALDEATSSARDSTSFKEGTAAPHGWDSIAGGATREPPTKDQVEQHIKPLLDKVGHDNVTVHDSLNADTVPADLRRNILAKAAAQHYDPSQIRGVYSRDTDEVHIFAGAHNSLESSARTAVHEIVAHKGMRALLGDQHGPVMRDIYNNADREWIDDFMKQHGLDATDPAHQAMTADEYAAHLSERTVGQETPTILRKAVDAVRKVLRKMGIVKKWTDNDIRGLLRDSESGLAKVSAHGKTNEDRSDPLKFATDEERDPRVVKDPEHPLSSLAKYGATVEAQTNKGDGFIRSRFQAVKDFGQNHIETLLKAIPRRNLSDFMSPGKMPAVAEYIRQANRMDGRRNELLTKSESIGKNWNRYVTKNKEGGRLLGEMMHASTLAGVDPSKEYSAKYKSKDGKPLTDEQRAGEMQRRQQYAALKPFWDKLDPQAKQIFHQVRDHYVDQRRMVEQGLRDRISASGAAENTKRSLMDELRQKFEAGRVQEPYFPLARFGDYWAVAKDEDNETASFSRFEAPSDQRAWRAEMEKNGFSVDGGKRMDNKTIMQKVDPKFVSKIAEHLNSVDPKLADDVWQHFLRNMPEMSMRKAFIHRQGRLGFTADALRAFGNTTFHSAHQIAKLENVHQLQGHLQNAESQARQLEVDNDSEAHWSAPLVKELKERHEWAMQPQASSLAARLTALGHFWYLGTSPAHAFIFATQNPMVAFPTLAAKHGWTAAGRELARAQGQYAGSWGPLANRLRGDERDAFDEAQRIGLFSRTNANTLLGVKEAGGSDYNPNGVWTKAKEVAGYLMHKADEMNRQTTFLAAYRLGRADGMDHNSAIMHAEDMTWDSHFDYSNANRAKPMQSGAAKVVFLFRQYMMNMVYRIARDARNGLIPGEASSANTPELRSEARQRLVGVLGQLALASGTTGMPLYWAVEAIVNTIMGDEDKPYDMTTAARAHLTQQFGPTASKAIMDGPFDALSGATLSSRVELNHLWLKDVPPELDGQDKFLHMLGEAAGPIGSIAMSGFEAAKLAKEQQYERAIETLSPKVLRDQMKAVRFAREGAVNLKGEEVMGKDEFTKKDIFLQSMGFTPSSLQTRYEQNSAIKTEADLIKQRRELLMNRLFLAAHNDDAQGVQDAMDAANKFSVKNPGVAIRGDNIIGAARSRAKMSAENVNGLRVDPGLAGLRDSMNFETQNPEPDQ